MIRSFIFRRILHARRDDDEAATTAYNDNAIIIIHDIILGYVQFYFFREIKYLQCVIIKQTNSNYNDITENNNDNENATNLYHGSSRRKASATTVGNNH